MKEFRIHLRVKNNRLLRYREDLGLSAPQLAEAVGISYSLYIGFEGLRKSPLANTPGEWLESAQKIAAFHGVSCEELWPRAVRELKEVAAERRVSSEELVALADGSDNHVLLPSEVAMEKEIQEALLAAIAELSLKQQQVLGYRFRGGLTRKQIGENMCLTASRIAQIEASALQNLRWALQYLHPELQREGHRFVVHRVEGQTWLSCGHLFVNRGTWKGPSRVRCFRCLPVSDEEKRVVEEAVKRIEQEIHMVEQQLDRWGEKNRVKHTELLRRKGDILSKHQHLLEAEKSFY